MRFRDVLAQQVVRMGQFSPLDVGWAFPSPFLSGVVGGKDDEDGENGTGGDGRNGQSGGRRNRKRSTNPGLKAGRKEKGTGHFGGGGYGK